MGLKYTNNAASVVTSPPSGTTGLSFSVADASKFPSLGAGDYMIATRDDGSGNIECVRVSARSGNAFTIASGGRGFDGTTAYTWSAGDLIELRVPRVLIENLVSKDNDDTKTSRLTFAGAILQEDMATSIAAASTTDLGTATGNFVSVTNSVGTVNIASFGGATTVQAGTRFEILVSLTGGAVNLVHSGTLQLPTNANIALEAGDTFFVRKIDDGVASWIVTEFTRRSGRPLNTGNTGAAVLAASTPAAARSAVGVAAAEVDSFLAAANVAAARGALGVPTNVEVVTNLAIRNWVRNPEFRFWQRQQSRANSQVGVGTYRGFTADAWQANRSGDEVGLSVARVAAANAPPGFTSAMLLNRVSGNTSTATCSLYHTCTRQAGIALAGVPVALSFWARAGGNYSGGSSFQATLTTTPDFGSAEVPIYSFTNPATPISGTPALTGTWQRFFLTGTLPATQQWGVNFSFTPSGTAGADDSVYIGGVQVCPIFAGLPHTSIPFLRRPHEQELFELQAFFEKSYDVDVNPGTAPDYKGTSTFFIGTAGGGAGQRPYTQYFRQNKRKAGGSVTLYNPQTGVADSSRATFNNFDINLFTPGDIGEASFGMNLATGVPAGDYYHTHWTCDAEI